jgi:acetyl/propionyl-CoA carboxylase alpha subunit
MACGTLGPSMARRRIKNLLVANRGEIALRIIRTARTLGIRTIAVYSDADATGLHVAAADDARRIGPADASQSYLNIDAIVKAARESGADAIHPGYGFLSERPEFARAVHEAGIIFVGPAAEVMAALGDKVAARRIAAEAGLPVVPGIETAELAAAREFAARAGYPVVVKAAAGGGGRGMRVVEAAAHFEGALEAATREAQAAFGDGRVFIEKYLARPRHVEIQLLGDEHGGVVALGERECSIQRRHQKIVEESPAPGLSDATRAQMAEAAIRLARAAHWTNAGTAEFLVEDERFYFLEVNARLQVEHPVTEMRFGCDLVAEQLKIAAGGKVTEPAAPRGAAIECRIYAEDAEHGFRPAVGRVMHLAVPAGPGVRFDSHLAVGLEVSAFYDGLLGKLICYGADRDEARRRMVAALDDFALVGVTHTAGFLRDVMASDPYRRADLSTRFIDGFFAQWRPGDDAVEAALLAAALVEPGARAADHRAAAGVRVAGVTQRSPWDELKGFELWKARR